MPGTMTQHPDESRQSREPRESSTSGQGEGITDEDLPEDLQPTDDNPLAQPLAGEDVKSPDELDVLGGKVPEQRDQDDTDETADSRG